ncbi:hypothetical protein Mterra_01514 [Calidithermus terrae]|uniref:Glyoxalase/fosfomycin resistance/dioxygenase domain-containing protein n=1 Tax=Calidithermus terrae TaxID=1408545 RepID=A0A399ERG5_9DEIN|nr:VOC family protein [Calidithermus terrae]RIH86163.1 hypothetical protein Mterra_01514 [Calidithermus terrae]
MHVAQVVCDYDEAIRFYTRKLRFWLLEGAGHVPALTRPARIPEPAAGGRGLTRALEQPTIQGIVS